jgi:hypothetical protein
MEEPCISFRKRTESLKKELDVSKLTDKEKWERTLALIREESDQFDQTTRTDAAIVRDRTSEPTFS